MPRYGTVYIASHFGLAGDAHGDAFVRTVPRQNLGGHRPLWVVAMAPDMEGRSQEDESGR